MDSGVLGPVRKELAELRTELDRMLLQLAGCLADQVEVLRALKAIEARLEKLEVQR